MKTTLITVKLKMQATMCKQNVLKPHNGRAIETAEEHVRT